MDTLNLSEKEETSVDEVELQRQMSGGANWFYWIAGLSLVNSAVFLAGGDWSFFAGLAITQVADALVVGIDGNTDLTIVKAVALIFDLMIAGVFALFGIFANRGQYWAFIAGIVIYLFDGLLMLWFGVWFSAAFHVFALIMIIRGLIAARTLRNAAAAV